MDFDSPETEQEFPGLYAESKSPDDEGRKILPVKKKKDKDKGYKAFEEDGSGGSHEDINKTSKGSSRFKFGKSSVKSTLSATSSKPIKVKLFGVDLKQVVQRNPNNDQKRPMIPRFLSKALDYLESEYKPGANFYKGTSHFKSKIQAVRHSLNYGGEIPLQDPQIVAGLVKLFVRELPTHILGTVLESKLEDGKVSEKKTKKLQTLYTEGVPTVHKAVFERLVTHMEVIGIDLTPLLRVSQKSLLLLKPVMTPLSVEDELKVEEARLSRIHSSLAKAKESKDKNKTKDNEEKLWEIQRNVTQLKRKLKQLHSNAFEEKEIEINCAERGETDEDSEKCVKNDGNKVETEGTSGIRAVQKSPVPSKTPEKSPTIDERPQPPPKEDLSSVPPEKISPKHDEILQPVPAPPMEAVGSSSKIDIDELDFTKTSTPFKSSGENEGLSGAPENGGILGADDMNGGILSDDNPGKADMGDGGILLETGERKETSLSPFNTDDDVGERNIKTPEALFGKELDTEDLKKVQDEWRFVIAEQLELLRLNHDLKRRIRDEHKQIKMIQMVRNHRSRVPLMKPSFHDPFENMSTEKLQEILQRFMESNRILTKETEQLADKVYDERMNLVQGRAEERCPFVGT